MSLVDRIVARRLFQIRDRARVLGADRLESPSAYGGWLLPVRLWCAVRYYRLKRDVLSRYAFARRIPSSDETIAHDLLELGCDRAGWADHSARPALPWWSFVLRAWFFYPAILAAVAFAIWTALEWRQREVLHEAMAVMVPNYASLVHERTSLRVAGASARELRRADDEIASLRQRIADALPSQVRSATERALLVMADERVDDESVRREVVRWQQALRASEVPYVVEAHLQRAPCLTLLPGSFEMRAFAIALAQTTPGEECRVTVLLPYHVRERARYASSDRGDHTVTYLYRADTMPIRETALGLTDMESHESVVFLDRVRRYTVENVMPVLDGESAGAMFPLWVTLTPDAERLTKRAVQTSLENVYGGRLASVRAAALDASGREEALSRARLSQTLHAMDERNEEGRSWEELGLDALSSSQSALGGQTPVRALAPLPVPELEALEERLVTVVTQHELEHQLPCRPERALWRAGGAGIPEAELEPIARETAAYLRGLIAGEDVRHLLLAQLLSFATNPLAQAYTERASSRAIIDAMRACQRGGDPAVNLGESYEQTLMDDLRSLVEDADDAELGRYATCAYEGLFERAPAELTRR